MSNSELIKVELTREQAALFVLFQGHYDKIGFLIANQVFDIKRGDCTIHFDKEGSISSIEKRLFTYASAVDKNPMVKINDMIIG